MLPQSSRPLAEKHPKKVSSELQQAPWFQNLCRHIEEMGHLQIMFASICETELAQQCQLVLFKDSILYLQVSSAGWATRLRYKTADLIRSLQKFPEFKGIKTIHIKISQAPSPISQKLQPRAISQESAESIIAVAREIKDPELQKALLKLAENR